MGKGPLSSSESGIPRQRAGVLFLREYCGNQAAQRAAPGDDSRLGALRSANYALAATLGAPQALQVADRWHLVRNLADTLDAILRRQAPFPKSARKTAESKGQKNKPATPAFV